MVFYFCEDEFIEYAGNSHNPYERLYLFQTEEDTRYQHPHYTPMQSRAVCGANYNADYRKYESRDNGERHTDFLYGLACNVAIRDEVKQRTKQAQEVKQTKYKLE